MKNIILIGSLILLCLACDNANQRNDESPEQTPTINKFYLEDEKPIPKTQSVDIETLKKFDQVLFSNDQFLILKQNVRNGLSTDKSFQSKKYSNGVVSFFIEEFYGDGYKEVPVVTYVAGYIDSVNLGGMMQKVHHGENFISVPLNVVEGYNRIPFIVYSYDASASGAIEFRITMQ